jgi:hypothetical protein
MAYFPDLTPYTYSESAEPMVNVGWLDREHTFEAGDTDKRLLSALLDLCSRPVNVMRGSHDCDLCGEESPIRATGPSGPVFLGNGEIHVRLPSGPIYAAPTLIAHYVAAHGYQPPVDFVHAAIQNAAQ